MQTSPRIFTRLFDFSPVATALSRPHRQSRPAGFRPPIILLLLWGSVVVGLAMLAGPGVLRAKNLAGDQIGYVKSGRDPFVATLVPDRSPGSVPNDASLVETTTNGKLTAFQLSPDQEGCLGLSGRLPGLMDGRHKASVKTLTPGGSQKDYKQVLFIVDSKPPIIERVAPEGDQFPRTAGGIQFRITDPEGGSGVSIEPAECALNVAVSGASLQKKILSFDANELSLTVFVAFPDGAAEHDSNFTVSVSLQDRAGNVGRALETFTLQPLTSPVFNIYKCNSKDTYIQTGGAFLVEPAYSGMTLRIGMDRQLDIFTRGCFGKDYHYPESVREIMRREEGYDKEIESEIVTMNPFFQKTVGELIKIHSASGKVAIRKLEDGDLEDSRVSFRVSQQNPAPMGDQMDTLLVTVPVDFRIDATKVGFCEAKNKVDAFNEEDTIYNHIPEDACLYTFETIAIPVYLETAAESFSLMVEQEEDQLKAQVRFSPIELMDTGASWFAFLGDKYWFERQADVCVAKGPAREGTVHYRIGAAHKVAEFLYPESDGGTTSRTMMTEGDIVVCLDPPVIENFRYDRESNTLTADISDRGTPLDELSIQLEIDGYSPEVGFDPTSGELTVALAFAPVSVLTATLQVTDLAEQAARKTCSVYGDPEPEEDDSLAGDDAQVDTGSAVRGPCTSARSYYTKDVDQVLGTTTDGKALVRVCEEVMQWGYHTGDTFVPLGGDVRSLRLVQVQTLDTDRVYTLSRAIAEDRPVEVAVLGNRYDATLYAPLSSGSGVTSLTATDAQGSGLSRLTLYVLVTVQVGNQTFPINEACSHGLRFSYEAVTRCHMEARDILPPVIDAAYDADTGLLHATIHDHGMPLSELTVDFTARSDSATSNVVWGAGYSRNTEGGRPPFTFQGGLFTSQFTPPPSQGEFFVLRLSAQDKAGNSSYVLIDVVAPQTPPEVRLEVETPQSHQVVRRSGENGSVYLTAEAEDDSWIEEGKTTLWLDDQVLAPLYRYSHITNDYLDDPFHFNANYVSAVEEGSHLARFRATDTAGLWAEAEAAFDFELAPYIYSFKVMPETVQEGGGPALTAMILDLGGDLDIDGLALTIDGQAVDAADIYYDPASGYFAVDGPLALAEGYHLAALTATDSRGNQASDTLRFTRAMDITAFARDEGQTLAIDGLALMELEDHNGDGRANPGELVRFFVTLHNEAVNTFPCTGRLASEDPDIVVETESLLYDETGPDTMEASTGFDVRIGSDVLEKTISDPYEAYFNLRVGCEPDQEWSLPLTIPIHRPTIPIDTGMTLTLDRLPPTTTGATYRVQGVVESEAAFIDWMEIRVNGSQQGSVAFSREGGHFEALVNLADGANTIEVSGADSNGSRGSATGYIFRTVSFTPPSISITSPSGGDFYQCNDLTVTGTYSTGSGTLSSITVDAPWEMGNCTVTILDGSHFSVDCGAVTSLGGSYDIEATIETTDGVQAIDTITIAVGDCT